MVGRTGQIIRNVEIIDAKEATIGGVKSVSVRLTLPPLKGPAD
ncbi:MULTISPECIES: hypothetical protein [Bacillus cereus group]|nr:MULTISPECIES: hypothetical protein [Bacillus cereus group]WJE23153.1 hypothetical protein QRE65_00615 [Bacillus cereus]